MTGVITSRPGTTVPSGAITVPIDVSTAESEDDVRRLVASRATDDDLRSVLDAARFRTLLQPTLAAVAIAREPVSVDRIAAWSGLAPADVEEALRRHLRPWITEARGESGRRFHLYHQSVRDFVTECTTGCPAIRSWRATWRPPWTGSARRPVLPGSACSLPSPCGRPLRWCSVATMRASTTSSSPPMGGRWSAHRTPARSECGISPTRRAGPGS